MITVRAGVFKPAEGGAAAGKILDRSADAAGLTARRRFVELIQAEAGDVDITREDELVSVGRGIGDKENIAIVEELARAMGAALGQFERESASQDRVLRWLTQPEERSAIGPRGRPSGQSKAVGDLSCRQ